MSKRSISSSQYSEDEMFPGIERKLKRFPPYCEVKSKHQNVYSQNNSDSDCNLDSEEEPVKKRPTREPTCFSKNAIMARQNRLKKKQYMEDLEQKVVKLRQDKTIMQSILDNQSTVIQDLRKELKYFKSLLVNSADIKTILTSFNLTTGMPVTTSLDANLTMGFQKSVNNIKTNPTSQLKMNNNTGLLNNDILLSRSFSSNSYLEYSTPSSPDYHSDEYLNTEIFPDLYSNMDVLDDTPYISENTFTSNYCKNQDEFSTLHEHNYNAKDMRLDEEPEDIGVCLHVSKSKISIEFCSTCSEKAGQAWKPIEAE